MLVGNKLDLTQQDENSREVPFEAAQQFAKDENLMFIETSALANNNVKDAFEILMQEIYNQKQKMPKTAMKNPVLLDSETPGSANKGGCC